MMKRSNGRHTPMRIHIYVEERLEPQGLKNQNQKYFFPGCLERPPWKILLGSSMPSSIEVARLESCQKWGELSVE